MPRLSILIFFSILFKAWESERNRTCINNSQDRLSVWTSSICVIFIIVCYITVVLKMQRNMCVSKIMIKKVPNQKVSIINQTAFSWNKYGVEQKLQVMHPKMNHGIHPPATLFLLHLAAQSVRNMHEEQNQ